MFEHLDDPSPPAPTARTLGAVLARAARLRRRRARSSLAVMAAAALGIGLAVGLAVPRAGTGSAATAFDLRTGLLPIGTLVPTSDLADVVFIDDVHGFALALHDEQTVLASSHDGGDTWRVVDDDLPTGAPAQFEFADTTHGYLWGGAPSAAGAVALWVTSDGGRTWTQAPVGPVVSDVSAIGPDVWAVVGTCPISSTPLAAACAVRVEVSGDDGITWTTTPGPPPVSEDRGLSVNDQDIELARITLQRAYVLTFAPESAITGSSSGLLAFTADGGATWVARPDPCPSGFDFGEQIAASGTHDLWLMCASQASAGTQAKALYRSHDGGATWTSAAAANAPVLTGNATVRAAGALPSQGYVTPYSLGHDNLAVLTPSDAWLFPDRTAVFRTTDGGRTWRRVVSLAHAGLVVGASGDVVFANPTHGWVCETGAGLWRTINGTTWQRLG
jgi:photosystem II stability/assembly factor-like uncharacterized protein